jgi:hypothetical protein
METPFGPFEPSVELEASQMRTVERSLMWLDHVRTSHADLFGLDHASGQPLIVIEINGKRLELPAFEAAELDCQRMVGLSTSNEVPVFIDGERFHDLLIKSQNLSSSIIVDALVSLMMVLINHVDLLPQSLKDALK